MTDQSGEPPQDQPQQVRSSHIGALVPANVARGIFSTGVAVLQGNHEFIVDFLLQMQQPQQVAARVILPPAVVRQFLQALAENITKYESRFGAIVLPTAQPPAAPATFEQPGITKAPAVSSESTAGSGVQSPETTKHSAEDLYDHLRLSEEVMSGQYANAVMIGHTASEFSFDFIATFYPRSVVVQRVFLSAPNVPRLRDSLAQSFEQFLRRTGNPPPPGKGSGQPEHN
ncbi:MAG: DUF3467 domain-containing protein [Fuerstiella sp.]|nr:DUF3467 domain-containing protein [Fuerstiella sp.]